MQEEIVDDDDTHLCLRCRKSFVGLDIYVEHRKTDCRSNTNVEEQNNILVGANLEEEEEEEEEEVVAQHVGDEDEEEEDAKKFPTATDALASEAAFMENIGLYLNPRPALNLRTASGLLSPGKGGQSHQPGGERDDWEDSLVLQWPYSSSTQDEVGAAKAKPSLLSYLNKPKTTTEAAKQPMDQSDFMRQIDLVNVSGQPSTSSQMVSSHQVKWRIWNPEQEPGVPGDDLWNDLLASAAAAAGDIYLDTVANDPTLMEVSVGNLNSTPRTTSGKWIPQEKFYCKHCDRALSSNEAYEKHLLSELHFKRSSSEIDTVTGPRKIPSSPSPPLKAIEAEIDQSEPQVVANCAAPEETTRQLANSLGGLMMTCESCQSKVQRHRYGKHLISHYHHHRSLGHPSNRGLVLAHIEDIVKEAPYQCHICRFYCNWDHEFVDHWNSSHLLVEQEKEEGHYWCSFCRFMTRGSQGMADHLGSEEHCEIVSVINRSVPIVIRRPSLTCCHVCDKQFRLKFSLRHHMRHVHGEAKYELEDHARLSCHLCTFATFSQRSLTSHTFLVHANQKLKYSCKICQRHFANKASAEKHRRSLAHRTRAKQSSSDKSPAVNCVHCGIRLDSLQELKDHVWSDHPTTVSQCCHCGMSFPLPQDLGAHVRTKCEKSAGGRLLKGAFTCGQCNQFSCTSKSTLLYHVALKHGATRHLLQCPECQKSFKGQKPSKLLRHVRIHDHQNKHRCGECYAIFSSEAELTSHCRSHVVDRSSSSYTCHQCDYSGNTSHLLDLHVKRMHDREDKELFECPKCGHKFKTERSLGEHVRLQHQPTVRRYACNEHGCTYSTSKLSAMRSHKISHEDPVLAKRLVCDQCHLFTCKRLSEMNRHKRLKHGKCVSSFSCDFCEYTAASRQHLDRHQLVHANGKQLQCRMCTYTCSTEENMRKHILKTKKHIGLSVYVCEHCDFAGNSKSQFQAHLRDQHSPIFPSVHSVKLYLSHYFVAPDNNRKQLAFTTT